MCHLRVLRNYSPPPTGHGNGTRFREAAKIASELPSPRLSPPLPPLRSGKIFRVDPDLPFLTRPPAEARHEVGLHGCTRTRPRKIFEIHIGIFTEVAEPACLVTRRRGLLYFRRVSLVPRPTPLRGRVRAEK